MSERIESAGPEQLVYERALPAVPIAVGWMRRELDAELDRMGVGRARRHDVALVFSEAAANVVTHAYGPAAPGVLYALATLGGGDLRLDVFDRGHGMMGSTAGPGLGVGLALMAKLSDAMEIATNDGGGVQVSALFHQIGGAPGEPARSGADALADYVDALRATCAALEEDTRAVRSQAELAMAQSRKLRAERRRGALS